MPKHALMSPSSAHRWVKCPGSVPLTKDLPDEQSPYAVEGTTAHRFCELYLKQTYLGAAFTKEDADELASLKTKEPEEMWDAVKTYAACIDARRLDPVIDFNLEVPLNISLVTNEYGAKGTADCVFIDGGGTLWIVDFKYGRGVEVKAEKNFQLMLYACAYLKDMDPITASYVKEVGLLIVQPRIGNVDEWRFKADELDDIAGFFAGAAAEVQTQISHWNSDHDESQLVLRPSEGACRFCKAKATCPALRRQVAETVKAQVDDVPDALPVPTEPDQVSKALGWLPLIKTWTEAVEAHAVSLLSSGGSVPGFKLVAGRAGPRAWDKDQTEEIEKLLKGGLKVSEVYEKKLISPTAAEKLAKKKVLAEARWAKLQECITRSDPKPVLVPVSDPRDALQFQKTEEAFPLLEN